MRKLNVQIIGLILLFLVTVTGLVARFSPLHWYGVLAMYALLLIVTFLVSFVGPYLYEHGGFREYPRWVRRYLTGRLSQVVTIVSGLLLIGIWYAFRTR